MGFLAAGSAGSPAAIGQSLCWSLPLRPFLRDCDFIKPVEGTTEVPLNFEKGFKMWLM